MKIALINIIKDKNVYPLNLVALATYVRNQTSSQIRIIDANWDDIITETIDFNPDIIGISAMSITYGNAVLLARKLKEKSSALMIIGGAHINTRPSALAKEFDLGVVGEGEETLAEIAELMKEKKSLSLDELKEIKGIIYHDNEKAIINQPRDFINPLDKLPIPDVELLNKSYFIKKDHHTFKGKVGIIANLMTSRGCPYACAFCASPVIWKRKVRIFSVNHVAEEIEYLAKNYKVNLLQVYDDIFSISKIRLRELISLLKEKKLLGKIKFACQSRVDTIDEEMCEILKELGVETISFGFESGSETTLNYLKVGTVKVEQNRATAKMVKKHGFNVYGSLIIGNPNEKIEDIKKTIEFVDFLKEIKADGVDVFIACPFPGTKFWDYAIENNRLPKDFELNPPDFYHPESAYLIDSSINKEEFIQTYKKLLEELTSFSQRRSILSIVLYPKEPRIKTVLRAIHNPKEVLKRITNHLI